MINMCIKERCILVHAGLLMLLAWPQIGTLALRLIALNCFRFNYCTLFIHFVSSGVEYMKENKDSVACQVKNLFYLKLLIYPW